MLGPVLILILSFNYGVEAAMVKGRYEMDKSEDCSLAGYLEIPDGQDIYINGRSTSPTSSVLQCTLRFRAKSQDSYIKIHFASYAINDCNVVLLIVAKGAEEQSKSYSCSDPMPGEIIAKDGDVIMKLDRKYIDGRDYNFLILVQTYKPDQVFNGPNSSEVNIPLVAGIVAGVIFFLVILAVICICCYRKRQHIKQGQGEYKVSLDEEQGNNSYSYSNEVLRNGNTSNKEFESPVSQKKLLSNRNDKNTPLIDSNKYVADDIVFKFDELHKSNERSVKDNPDKHPKLPKSPILDALQNNAKFRKNFTQNETDADERANRISGFTSESVGSQSSVESPPPPLLPPAKKVSKSQKPLRHHASIRRAYRQSSSNEEIGSISADEYDDKNIKLICDNTDPPSPSEVIPIKVTDPRVVVSKPKHTLRPNRGKSLQDKRTQVKNKDAFVSEYVHAPPQSVFQRSNSQCKLSAKSPRIGRSSKGSDGQDLDDFDSFSRPGTPTSVMSRGIYRDEDTESFSPHLVSNDLLMCNFQSTDRKFSWVTLLGHW
ncbi:uncharacterized protein LOC130013510 isoform X2 [Patella vulgata]|uniref:uncharacterized protein LOC130013510 isoform X2 n=1 Tax=Patella vulgata TaxID=6465 RepID=UPI0024A972BD|nr:uncharacterized protein LOC130013510 isoform X2 [Patella vulgata]